MRRFIGLITLRTALIVAVGLGLGVNSDAQRLTWLGVLNGARSEAHSVSADGNVVAGTIFPTTSTHSSIGTRAFRWTEQDGMQDLGMLDDRGATRAYGVSANGTTIVGESGGRAFVWTASEGMRSLSLPFGYTGAAAFGISPDGRYIVGRVSRMVSNFLEHVASYWRFDGSVTVLSMFWGVNSSRALGVSAEGRVIVGEQGFLSDWQSWNRAFRRIYQVQDLGTLGGTRSIATAVSANGMVSVGGAQDSGNFWVPVRWNDTQTERLAPSPSVSGIVNGRAMGVSLTGRVIVGWFIRSGEGERAFRWTRATGLQDLNQVYANLLADGSRLISANAVSLDGRYIVGFGYNASTQRFEAFRLDTEQALDTEASDINGDGCVDDADLLIVLFNFGGLGLGDVNLDGTVDDADLLIVLFNFGRGC